MFSKLGKNLTVMNKNLITSLLLLCTLYFSCSKSKQPGPQDAGTNTIKITLVSGSGQTDTVGQTLLSPIVIKVTQNGAPVSGYTVQFTGSGCNSDRVDLASSKSDGTISYNWSLAGDIGPQTLKAYAINSQNIKVDSVTAMGTGVAPGSGRHYSACSVQLGYMPTSFCKLSTGRLFVSYGGLELRYSDDNGASWNLVASLGKTHNLQFVLSSPTDELFAFSVGDGIFYSSDAGATWTIINANPFNIQGPFSAVCTPSGKLLVADGETINISLDKGKTWAAPAASFGDTQIGSPTEDKNGSLYVVGEETQTIFKSTDNGVTWTIPHPTERDFAIYVDNNNTFYRSTTGGGIYISKDNGVTYTQLVNAPNELIENMSVQSDGNFYYDLLVKGLYVVKGTNQAQHLDDNESSVPTVYILSKNNNIVYSSFTPYINYYPL
jgi:hypothetical protein